MFVNKWARFCFLVLGGGTILKLSGTKDVFYVSMQNDWGLTNTQIGLSFTVYTIVQTTGLFLSLYIADRYPKKILSLFGLIGAGLCGLYLATLPSFTGHLICFAVMAFFADAVYWPVLLKAVCSLGTKEEQGCMFGFLEAGRGAVDAVTASGALPVFVQSDEGKAGMQVGLPFYAVITLVAGIVTYSIVDDDKVEGGEKTSANMEVLKGIKHVLSCPNVWLVSLGIFFVYAAYRGLTYLTPSLKDIYMLPVALVGAYSITNQYVLKMVGGPIGGMLADKVAKLLTVYLKRTFLIFAVVMFVSMQLPRQTMNMYIDMAATLGSGAITSSQRAIFFASMDEIGTLREYVGSVMAFGCIIGCMSAVFAYTSYGHLLGTNSGTTGYNYVLSVMVVFSLMGSICSTTLVKRIKKQKLAVVAAGA